MTASDGYEIVTFNCFVVDGTGTVSVRESTPPTVTRPGLNGRRPVSGTAPQAGSEEL
jgi:hypothetical protein